MCLKISEVELSLSCDSTVSSGKVWTNAPSVEEAPCKTEVSGENFKVSEQSLSFQQDQMF